MANVIRCDRIGCENEIPSGAMQPGWYLIHYTYLPSLGSHILVVPHEQGPFHICSTECLVQWSIARRHFELNTTIVTPLKEDK